MSVPKWVQDAIIYQIFPDRFYNGDPSNDPPNLQAWGEAPNSWGFQGGDLAGVIQKLDYLLDLGVNTLYLTPIFQASSNHRYNPSDYYQIDPKLGTLADFRALVEMAHRKGLRVILDGVFNHCGRGFFAFNDILENGEHSPYRNWFHIHRFPPDAYSSGYAQDYDAWWGIKSQPEFNTDHPEVRQYLFDVARYWIEQGADGWRLDVPNEIDDDSFWEGFRDAVKSANPQAVLLGEIWTVEPRWVGGKTFDGLMNYPLRDAILRLLYAGTLDIPHFADRVDDLIHAYPPENVRAMYLPLGSHDTERLIAKLEGDRRKVKFAYLMQMTFPGIPAVYYGDEIGLPGEKDPDCRRAFPWDESTWDSDLRDWVQKLIALRKACKPLRRGDYERVCACSDGSGCLAYSRTYKKEKILVILNASDSPVDTAIPLADVGWTEHRLARSLLYDSDYPLERGELAIHLPAWSGDILRNAD